MSFHAAARLDILLSTIYIRLRKQKGSNYPRSVLSAPEYRAIAYYIPLYYESLRTYNVQFGQYGVGYKVKNRVVWVADTRLIVTQAAWNE